MGRADGIHFGTNEDMSSGIFTILSQDAPTVVNEPEARWHMADIARRRPQALNVYRASPDRKPAERGWDAHTYSRDVFRSIDELHDRTGYYPTDILLLNELNLDYERGEDHDDGGAWDSNPDNWPSLYRGLSRFLSTLLSSCQARAADRGFSPRWWYQGWAPGHGDTDEDVAQIWVPTARLFDGICYHAYTDADQIEARTRWYADTFPDKPLLLGEWNTIDLGQPNSDQRYEEEVRIRTRLRQLCAEFSTLQCCYFIWAWAEDLFHQHDIAGNDRRLSLWDGRVSIPGPGTVTPPLPPPVELPVENFPLPVDDRGNEWKASPADMFAAIHDVAREYPDIPDMELALVALGFAESGMQPGQEFQQQERWHRWTDHGIEAVRQRNVGYAAEVLSWGRDVGAIGTNDFSAGAFHQAMAWWDGFPGNPTDRNDPYRWDVMTWLSFRKGFIQDHGAATRYAAERIAPNMRARPDDIQWVLERYNKPAEEVSDGVRANYARALAAARVRMASPSLPETPEGPPVSGTPRRTVYHDRYDRAPAGAFTGIPNACILHGSRSARRGNPKAAEFAGTSNWNGANPDGLSWNATIGELEVSLHQDPKHWGWSAFSASPNRLAVEFAQATVEEAITEEQVEAFCDWWEYVVRPVWPNISESFVSHAEVEHSGETVRTSGKDDVFPFGSDRMNDLRYRIARRLEFLRGALPEPEPGPPTSEPVDPENERERLISAVGYMSGDLAERIEQVRAAVASDIPRSNSKMTKADLRLALDRLWASVDLEYAELGNLKDELQRVGRETL